MNLKWLAVVFVFGLVFAETVISTDLGYVDIDGVVNQGEHFTLENSTLKVTAASTMNFTAHNYSVSVTPKNLERIAADLGIPLGGEIEQFVPGGQVQTQTIVLPDIVCGTYKVSGELYYTSGEVPEVYTDSLKLSIPCKDFKSRLVSGIVARVPYPILKFFAGLFGVGFS